MNVANHFDDDHRVSGWMRRLAMAPITVMWLAPSQCDWIGLRVPRWLREPPPDAQPAEQVIPKRETLIAPVPQSTAKTPPETVTKRETLNGHKKPIPPDRLPDEVVMKLIEVGRAGFTHCFKKAATADPLTLSLKVKLHAELTGHGTLIALTADTSDPTLASCLLRVGRGLPFPAPGRAVAFDMPLFYRAE